MTKTRIASLLVAAFISAASFAQTSTAGIWRTGELREIVNGGNSTTVCRLEFKEEGTFNYSKTISADNIQITGKSAKAKASFSISSTYSYAGTYVISGSTLNMAVDPDSISATVESISLKTDIPEMQDKKESTEKLLMDIMNSNMNKELKKEFKKKKNKLEYQSFSLSDDCLSYFSKETGKTVVYHKSNE